MTKEEFNNQTFRSNTLVQDTTGTIGRVSSINFDFGVIHFTSLDKGKNFGRHYSEITSVV